MRRGIQEADREAFSDDAQFWHDVLAEGDLDAVSETVGELLDGKEITETERRTLSIGMIETFIKARERGEARASGGAFTSLDVEPGASLCPLAPVAPAMAPIPTEERHWCLPDDQRLAEDLVARVTIPATRIVFPVSRLVVEVEGGGPTTRTNPRRPTAWGRCTLGYRPATCCAASPPPPAHRTNVRAVATASC